MEMGMLNIILNDSSGGVGAKIASCPGALISRATSLLLMLGCSSSPLFVSTQRTLMGLLPIFILASLIDLISQTPFDLKYSSSFRRAALHNSGGSGKISMDIRQFIGNQFKQSHVAAAITNLSNLMAC